MIGESHRELQPNSSGPAAILRIFGVTREGLSVISHVVSVVVITEKIGTSWKVVSIFIFIFLLLRNYF